MKRKPTASSASWPGVRMVTAMRTGCLAGPFGPDLQRLLDRDGIAPRGGGGALDGEEIHVTRALHAESLAQLAQPGSALTSSV